MPSSNVLARLAWPVVCDPKIFREVLDIMVQTKGPRLHCHHCQQEYQRFVRPAYLYMQALLLSLGEQQQALLSPQTAEAAHRC